MQSTRIRVEFLSIFKWRELRFENSPQQWPGWNWKKGRKKKKAGNDKLKYTERCFRTAGN